LDEGECFFVVVLVDCRGLPLLLRTLAMLADSKDLASFSTISESVAYRNNRLSLGKGFLT
jgi:hypothetical protein